MVDTCLRQNASWFISSVGFIQLVICTVEEYQISEFKLSDDQPFAALFAEITQLLLKSVARIVGHCQLFRGLCMAQLLRVKLLLVTLRLFFDLTKFDFQIRSIALPHAILATAVCHGVASQGRGRAELSARIRDTGKRWRSSEEGS